MISASNRAAQPNGANVLLDAALDNMPFGFSLWDEDRRFAGCNRRYLEIYQFPPDRLKIGMTLLDICTLSVALGNHPRSRRR